MSDFYSKRTSPAASAYGDALSAPFWEGASRRVLLLQRCKGCGSHQFYPRPFCLSCDGDELGWVEASGTGRVYSVTTVRRQVAPELPAPYQAAIVELDEGVRMLTNLVGRACAIGERVRVTWRERPDAPPLPVFESIGEE